MLLSFSRGAWINLGVAMAIYGALYILTVRNNRARLQIRRARGDGDRGPARAGRWLPCSSTRSPASPPSGPRSTRATTRVPRAGSAASRRRSASSSRTRSASARSSSCRTTTTRSRTTSISAMFLNAGWLGGCSFWASSARPPVGPAPRVRALRHAAAVPGRLRVLRRQRARGRIIDLDHWRHFYLLMALVWGLMLGGTRGVGGLTRRQTAA